MNAYEERKLRRESLRKMLPVLIGTAVISLLLGAGAAYYALFGQLSDNEKSVLQAMQTVDSRFVGDYDKDIVTDYMLDGMIYALDDQWSYYLTSDQYRQVQASRTNHYIGIGVTIQRGGSDAIMLLDITEGGPAQASGLKKGDAIVSVDGVEVTEETWQACVDSIGGREGSIVTLGIRSPKGDVRTVEVERREIETIPVQYEMLEGDIGLVRVINFYSGSAEAFIAAVKDLEVQGAQGIVFDVRDNPGGYVTELTKMLDFLLPAGLIFQSHDVSGKEDSYTSDAAHVDLPFVVLVNAESYSAAELFAAQLNETVQAPIVGEKTSGKGYAQQLIPLRNGSALGLSTSKYTTGQGRSLVGEGLAPQPEISLGEEKYEAKLRGELTHGDDDQLQAALEELHLIIIG